MVVMVVTGELEERLIFQFFRVYSDDLEEC